MYYQVEQVLDKYEPQTENFYKGRGILICETKQGLFALKEYFGSAQKAEFLYWLGTYMEKQGLRCDRMIKNREDALVTEGIDGVTYTMHHWLKGKECDVKSRMDIMMSISHMAKFHAVCSEPEIKKQYKSEKEMFPEETWNDRSELKASEKKDGLYEEYTRHDRELKKIYKFISKRRNKSDFERLYLSCFPEFYKQSQNVVSALKERRDGGGGYTVGICHGDFNQHNILFSAGEPGLIHLERAYIGKQIADLGNFMRKILEKYGWEERLGMEMLHEYVRVHSLTQTDLQGLYYRLSYPEKFWKIANHYYNSSKVWDSGINRGKLQKEIQQNVSRRRFLRQFEQSF